MMKWSLLVSCVALTGCKSFQDYWNDSKNDDQSKSKMEQPADKNAKQPMGNSKQDMKMADKAAPKSEKVAYSKASSAQSSMQSVGYIHSHAAPSQNGMSSKSAATPQKGSAAMARTSDSDSSADQNADQQKSDMKKPVQPNSSQKPAAVSYKKVSDVGSVASPAGSMKDKKDDVMKQQKDSVQDMEKSEDYSYE